MKRNYGWLLGLAAACAAMAVAMQNPAGNSQAHLAVDRSSSTVAAQSILSDSSARPSDYMLAHNTKMAE